MEPLQGYVVSSTGNFEWLEPQQPPLRDYRISLSFHSLSAVVIGSEEEIQTAKERIIEGTKIPEKDLRLQTVRKVASRFSLADYCDALYTIIDSTDEMADFVCGQPVVEAFSMPLQGEARIVSIPKVGEVNARIARSLGECWLLLGRVFLSNNFFRQY